ncbi:type II secretion system protein [Mesobacillus harenae]|uniref:type II secretion system protein n=1 Tax=Mesobacillus harenae TaxID=2213203 RepID=UPI001580283F|nr:hypothetical protein [Mesobacillus harenae]
MKDSNGLTLIDLISVIAILGILAGIAVPSVISVIENSRSEVCLANQEEVERMYEAYLDLEYLVRCTFSRAS